MGISRLGAEENHKHLRIVCVLPEIVTGHFPHTSQKFGAGGNLLDSFLWRLVRTRQAVYVKGKVETRPCNRCYREKQYVLIIMSECPYSCLSYLAWKSHLFCAVLYCHLWTVRP